MLTDRSGLILSDLAISRNDPADVPGHVRERRLSDRLLD